MDSTYAEVWAGLPRSLAGAVIVGSCDQERLLRARIQDLSLLLRDIRDGKYGTANEDARAAISEVLGEEESDGA